MIAACRIHTFSISFALIMNKGKGNQYFFSLFNTSFDEVAGSLGVFLSPIIACSAVSPDLMNGICSLST